MSGFNLSITVSLEELDIWVAPIRVVRVISSEIRVGDNSTRSSRASSRRDWGVV